MHRRIGFLFIAAVRSSQHHMLCAVLQDQVGDTNGATLKGAAWDVACTSAATRDKTVVRAPGQRIPAVSDDAWALSSGGTWNVYALDTHVVGEETVDVVSGRALRSRWNRDRALLCYAAVWHVD